jgi:hypothetical protein
VQFHTQGSAVAGSVQEQIVTGVAVVVIATPATAAAQAFAVPLISSEVLMNDPLSTTLDAEGAALLPAFTRALAVSALVVA